MTPNATTTQHCPHCDSRMQPVAEERPVTIGHRSAVVRDEFLRCGTCGEEVYRPGQMEATQKRASRAIRRDEGLLQPEQIRALRERLGLTQRAFEELIGAGPKTVVRWEKGTVFQNSATDTLLRIIGRFPDVARFLAVRNGVELPHSAEV